LRRGGAELLKPLCRPIKLARAALNGDMFEKSALGEIIDVIGNRDWAYPEPDHIFQNRAVFFLTLPPLNSSLVISPPLGHRQLKVTLSAFAA